MAGVLDGSIPACKAIRQAVERHKRDLRRAGARGFYFDEEAAELVATFFRPVAALEGGVGRAAV